MVAPLRAGAPCKVLAELIRGAGAVFRPASRPFCAADAPLQRTGAMLGTVLVDDAEDLVLVDLDACAPVAFVAQRGCL